MNEIWIAAAICTAGGIAGYFIGSHVERKNIVKTLKFQKRLSEKHLKLFHTALNWLRAECITNGIAAFFRYNRFHKVAVYGVGELGCELIRNLQCTGIEVVCAIDRQKTGTVENIPIIKKDDIWPEIDVVVVTPVASYDEIEIELLRYTDEPIVSLDEVIEAVKNRMC